VEALEAIAGEKQPLLDQIQALADPRTTQQDLALRELVQRTHHLNLTNARLLALQRNSCDSRLNILRGVNPATSLYRANGYLGQ
jgi:flagellar biosynthesis/type III secretory pathway chaperone